MLPHQSIAAHRYPALSLRESLVPALSRLAFDAALSLNGSNHDGVCEESAVGGVFAVVPIRLHPVVSF